MFSQTLPRKLVQISEEALPPVQVPLILGHDLFILSYQDVRKIEDSRLFSINKLMPNGDLKSLHIQNPSEWLLQILKQENLLCNQNLCQLLEFLNDKRNHYQQCQQQQPLVQPQQQYYSASDLPSCPQPMEVSMSSGGNPTVASIEQQLQWNKCLNTSPPYPMTYSLGTSTTEINFKQDSSIKTSSCCCCCLNCKNCKNSQHFCNKSINTVASSQDESKKLKENLGAREQLKKKKLNFSFAYVN